MDRGYIDFARLHALHLAQAFFVTRAQSNLQYRRGYSHPVDKTTGLRCDQTIMLTGPRPGQDYPVQLRRVKFYDARRDKLLVFLTNNFDLPALTVAELYRCRWQVELFFKWIKQHLRIKAFFGTSGNAVKTQVWIAIAVLCPRLHSQKTPEIRCFALHNPTDSELDPVRKNTTQSICYKYKSQSRGTSHV